MDKQEFIALLESLSEADIEVKEHLVMTDTNGKPLRDHERGGQVINDVVDHGDGRLYIERSGNEQDSEQDLIDLLKYISEFLPEIIEALKVRL